MNKLYWELRQEKKFLAGEKKVNDYYKDLERAFEQAKREIRGVIDSFYIRYAGENGVSFADAQKLLSKAEIGDLKSFINRTYEKMDQYNLKLNNMSIKVRITRYQALEKQIDAILQQLYALDYQYKGEELLKEIYDDAYYRTWYNIDVYKGFHQEFAGVNPYTVDELIKYPFNGADFSSRLWKQKDHMLHQLNQAITTMLIQGKNPSTLSKSFAKRFNTKEFEAYRLLHTESSFILEQGTFAAYKEDEVEKYKILATLDVKTSDICRRQDGKIYKVNEAVVGVNLNPFHMFCRTTTVPYYDDIDYSDSTRSARDPVTGKPYKVPSEMKYEQWYNEYIRSNQEAMVAEKKWKNRHADKKQHEKYKDILGDNLYADSLETFQDLKYNDINKWATKKREYNTIHSIKKKNWSDTYKEKVESTYYSFRKDGIEMSAHGAQRFVDRKNGKNGQTRFTKEDVVRLFNKNPNYKQSYGRLVNFENKIAIIKNDKTNEIISIVYRNNPKEGWDIID